jgi:hypothetical protein
VEEMNWESLRDGFREGVLEFEKKIFHNIKPKMINNK